MLRSIGRKHNDSSAEKNALKEGDRNDYVSALWKRIYISSGFIPDGQQNTDMPGMWDTAGIGSSIRKTGGD